MAIKKVVKSSVSQQVFDQLQGQILAGAWKSGDKLPSENDLAAQFGVSRVTVRNALQKLSGLGLIETRFGEGSFVRGPEAGAAFNQLVPMLYLGEETARDVLTFRRMVEGPICEIACRRTAGGPLASFTAVAVTGYSTDFDQLPERYVECAGYKKVASDKVAYAKACRIQRDNQDVVSG